MSSSNKKLKKILATGYWLLATGYWLLATGYRLLVTGWRKTLAAARKLFSPCSIFSFKKKCTDSHNNNFLGFTLVEVLLGIVILALITLTLYALINFALKVIWESKAKITATQLANQKIEMARNLPYADVGTIGGIPPGSIPQTEVVNRNGIDYTITTDVIYIDDPFDGTIDSDPPDTLNTDYKRIRIEVSWDYRLSHKPVVLISDVAPRGLETAAGGGTLKILVYNANGEPVAQADVSVINEQVDPEINIQTQTDNQGYLILPGAPTSTEAYQITVTKTGYSKDKTYDTTPELPSPEKPHASVFEDQTTNISFAIDQLSDINVWVQNENGILLSGIVLNIRGEKIIGYDASDEPVYKYNQSKTTNASGEITLNDIEWDSYHFDLPEDSDYNISETIPILPIDLYPDSTRNLTITLAPKAEHSALIIVKDVDDNPLDDAQVHFFSPSAGLDETLTTDESGQVYFTPWSEATTTLEVRLDGYEDYDDEFKVSGYHIEYVTMTVAP